MKEFCVYIHKNKINGHAYIGMTKDVKKRWSGKGTQYTPHGENKNIPFWNAIQKYGWNNFEHEILEEGLTYEEACEKETEYISKYREEGIELYNIAPGGNGGVIYKEHPKGMLGKQQTQHQIESHREWASNNNNNCMTNGKVVWGVTHKHPRGMKGKHHTEEHKKRISEMMKKNPNNIEPHTIIYPNGKRVKCKSLIDVSRRLGVSKPFAKKLVNSGKPYELSSRATSNLEVLKSLVGVRIKKDNTEVSD